MTSKKDAASKRAVAARLSSRTKEFDRDWDRLNRTGRFDMNGLKHAMMLLIANDEPMPAIYRDHALEGPWKGFRDCHIHGDFLLLYKLEGRAEAETVTFAAIGTHAELFR